jgi:phosphoribosyl 1,2-cyclic phosphodiesterase
MVAAPIQGTKSGRRRIAALTLTFLGTRGEITLRSKSHRRHSALLVESGRSRIMIDCGADWLGRLGEVAPTAIVLTHAHADHARGLAAGAPCPVYATEQTWATISRFPITDRRLMPIEVPVAIADVGFEAFQVEHSRLAPAVGYRCAALGRSVFYVPDVARLPAPVRALSGVDLFIGDGASPRRPMLRRRDGQLIGHASMIEQLRWCRQAGVHRAIFTHCGTQIVRMPPETLVATVRRLAGESCLEVRVACDGDKVRLNESGGFSWLGDAAGLSRSWRGKSEAQTNLR